MSAGSRSRGLEERARVDNAFCTIMSSNERGQGGPIGVEKNVVLRSVDLWIKGCVKYRAFLLRRRARFPSLSERRATTHVPTNLHRSVNGISEISFYSVCLFHSVCCAFFPF